MELAVMIDIQLIIDSLPKLLTGAWVTLQIALLTTAIGLILGTLFGIVLSIKKSMLRLPVVWYTSVIRGTPMVIQILFVTYALPQLLGITIPYFWSAVWAIGLNSAAYIAYIISSGITSIDKGQIEAAQVLGLSKIQTMRYIILPQVFRVMLPALGNELITLVKDSSLASIINVPELTKTARLIESRTLDALSMYCAVGIIYLIITSILSFFVNRLEARMQARVNH